MIMQLPVKKYCIYSEYMDLLTFCTNLPLTSKHPKIYQKRVLAKGFCKLCWLPKNDM